MSRPVYVYAFECAGFIKIGYAERTDSRLQALNLNCPLPVHLLARRQFPDAQEARAAEGRIHARLSEQRHKGEWFHSVPLSPVVALRSEYDDYAAISGAPKIAEDIDPREPFSVPRAAPAVFARVRNYRF